MLIPITNGRELKGLIVASPMLKFVLNQASNVSEKSKHTEFCSFCNCIFTPTGNSYNTDEESVGHDLNNRVYPREFNYRESRTTALRGRAAIDTSFCQEPSLRLHTSTLYFTQIEKHTSIEISPARPIPIGYSCPMVGTTLCRLFFAAQY